MSNRRPALLRESDARRLAKVAKSEGVCVEVEVGGIKIVIRPDDQTKPIDQATEIIL
jgi:hypothetical protein